MENILVIRLKAIGDVIFTLPAVNALRGNFPDAQIHFLTSSENAGLLRGFEEVNRVLTLDRAALRGGNVFKAGAELLGLFRRLRGGRFSHVVDFQGFGETAWLTRLTGAPHRWGSVHGPGRAWAYTRGIRRDDHLHFIDWNLRLLELCGVKSREINNHFRLPAEALATGEKFFLENGLDRARPALVIQPFTSTPQKNWPLENYLQVAGHWRGKGVQIIFMGGPADALPMESARAQGFCVATGLPLLGSAALVQLSALALGGNTGLMHLGVAQGRRVLMLMMHKQPNACFPFRHPDWAIVPEPVGDIRRITVQAVLDETGKALASQALG
jgi:3-deoxy-D-manno-octulosonic-acid transferase/heptosyltransferase-1